MKICTKCHKLKPLEDFCKDKKIKSGVKSICKDCMNKYNRKRRKKAREINTEEAEKIIGGIRISILNYIKKGEQKYNIFNTETGEAFGTNKKSDVINYLREI